MSSFFLYIHKDKPLDQKALQAITGKLIHFSWVKVSEYQDTNIQLIYTVNKTDAIRIFRNIENKLTFFLHGNIFESLNGIDKIGEDNTLEGQIIKRFLAGGISACVGLNGIYNLFVWHDKEELLEIASDRLGINQVFFANLNQGNYAFTTDISSLKYVPEYKPKISVRGLFDLIYMGIAFENRTVLEGVDRLLPYAGYQVYQGILKLVKENRLSFSKERWNFVVPRALDDLEHFYNQAIKRQFEPQHKILFLQSGGRDSRLYSHFLKKAGIIPTCITAGSSHHGEVFLAERVCRTLKFPWKRIPIRDNFRSDYAQLALEIDSFSSRVYSTYFLELINLINNDFDFATTTLFGDNVFGYLSGFKLDENGAVSSNFDKILAFFRQGFVSEEELENLMPLCGREFISEYKREASKLFTSLADEPFQMAIAYKFRANGRFKIGSFYRTLGAAYPVRSPYLDNDLMDFAFSLSPALLNDRFLLDCFFMLNSPRLGAIQFDKNSGYYSALAPSIKSEINFEIWRNYVNYIKLPLLRVLNPVSATTQFYAQIFSLKHVGFKRLQQEAISSLSCLEGILDIAKTKKILDSPLANTKDDILPGNSKRSLITAILTLKNFS